MTAALINRGLYDVHETAHLLGVSADRIVRWATPSVWGPAIVPASSERFFSFEELVSLQVVAVLHARGLSDHSISNGVQYLQKSTALNYPLASKVVLESLATSGSGFLADVFGDGYVDIGLKGHGVFQEVVALYLSKVTFDTNGVPQSWVPTAGVRLDPRIQAGAACVDGTRIPTETIAEMLEDAEPEDVALDFDISDEAVLIAEAFEEMLRTGAGLAAV